MQKYIVNGQASGMSSFTYEADYFVAGEHYVVFYKRKPGSNSDHPVGAVKSSQAVTIDPVAS